MTRQVSKYKTNAVALTLALTLGSLAFPSAEAAQTAKIPHRGRASIQEGLAARISLQGILDFLRTISSKDSGPNHNPGQNPRSDEGSGLCPNGRPRGQGQGGN
jgi:hypothetical protein